MTYRNRKVKTMALTIMLSAAAASVRAQLSGSGYYRLLNADTYRYLTVTNDNLGSSMEAAFSALVTVSGFDRVVSDPASVLYLRSVGDNQFDMTAQGADTYELTGYHFNIASADTDTYNIFARYLLTTYYIGDNIKEGSIRSQADLYGTAQRWYVLPVDGSDGRCFGFTPEYQDNSGYRYTTCYADFPFRLLDPGMKAYYVKEIREGYAIMDEIEGDIPANTPVILRCSESNASQNRAMPVAANTTAIDSSLLRGVYFNKTTSTNPNFTNYDEKTMRLLGMTSSGEIGMVKKSIYRLPSNKAYLQVAPSDDDELRLISREDYEVLYPPTPSDEQEVTVRALSYTRYYGEDNPVFDYTTEGGTLAGKPELGCDATSASPVGTYTITVSPGNVTNTKATYENGTLTVLPATLYATTSNAYRLTGEENPEVVVSYSGFKNNDDASVILTPPQALCKATPESEPGIYAITLTGGTADNYVFQAERAFLYVLSREISANDQTREYGEDNPEFDYTPEQPFGKPYVYTEATNASPVGTYDIVIMQGSLPVDGIDYSNAILTITPAPLVVMAADVEIEQGQMIPELPIVYQGWKLQDNEDVLQTKPTTRTEATPESPVGEYPIVVEGGEAQNYTLSYVNGKIRIREASGIRTVDADTNDYDVYNLNGQMVARKVTTMANLPEGVYLIKDSRLGGKIRMVTAQKR